MHLRLLVSALAIAGLLPAAGAASAQSYTSQPIRIVVLYTPGTGNDILGRTIAQRRVPSAADVPTLAEQGIKGTEVDIWYGLFAPAATPADVVARLHRAVNEILEAPETRAQLARQGLDVETATVEEFRPLMQRDSERWGRVARSAKLTAE